MISQANKSCQQTKDMLRKFSEKLSKNPILKKIEEKTRVQASHILLLIAFLLFSILIYIFSFNGVFNAILFFIAFQRVNRAIMNKNCVVVKDTVAFFEIFSFLYTLESAIYLKNSSYLYNLIKRIFLIFCILPDKKFSTFIINFVHNNICSKVCSNTSTCCSKSTAVKTKVAEIKKDQKEEEIKKEEKKVGSSDASNTESETDEETKKDR